MRKKTGNRRFALDLYRRFIDMFGDVVMGVKHSLFDAELSSIKSRKGVQNDQELEIDDLEELIQRYQKVYETHVGQPFPRGSFQATSVIGECRFSFLEYGPCH